MAGESAGTISGANLTLTASARASLQLSGGAVAGDIYLPDLAVDPTLGGVPSITLQGNGDDDAYGRGFIHLAASDAPLILNANGGTLAIASEISDQITGLAGVLPGAAAIVSGATPACNAAGAAYTTKINFNAVDDLGNTVALTAYFTKTAADVWQAALFDAGGTFPHSSVLATTMLTWNGSSFSGDPLVATLASDDQLRVDLSGLTQVNGTVSSQLKDTTPLSRRRQSRDFRFRAEIHHHRQRRRRGRADDHPLFLADGGQHLAGRGVRRLHRSERRRIPLHFRPAWGGDADFRRRRRCQLRRPVLAFRRERRRPRAEPFRADAGHIFQPLVQRGHVSHPQSDHRLRLRLVRSGSDRGGRRHGEAWRPGRFAGGVEIASGTTLELGASRDSAPWGPGSAQFFQVATVDNSGAPITVNVYVSPTDPVATR